MNNNKKYKKWSLGLVAPALVLAPIAVVASCSSSGEEKAVYSVSFKQSALSAEVSNKNIKPSKLSKEGFVQEIINNKANIFNIEDSSGQVTDDFLRKNLVVNGNITADDDNKKASAEVTLNNKNTDGGSENATITLTGFDYKDVDLANLTYTIKFKDTTQGPQEINLNKSDISVTSLDKFSLVKLVLEETTKAQILTIEGDNADKITNDVLENQILEVTEDSITPDKTAGTIKFELKVLNDGTTTKAEISKEIKFSGFKLETETPPVETDKFKIKFKTETEALDGVSEQSVNDFSNADSLKRIVIQNKDKIFEAESGVLPADEWWNDKLTISNISNLEPAEGSVTVDISLDGYDTTETATEDNATITKNGVVLKGFREEAQTEAKTGEISTVTLGLNGTVSEITEVNEDWVLSNKRLLFKKGFNLIKEASDIKDVTLTATSGSQNKKAVLSFKVVENKWFSADGVLGTAEQEFTINITGFPVNSTNNQLLANKSANPLSIALVDPALGEGTYKDYLDNSATIFTNDFVFKYRKHLLTGDFTKLDAADKDTFLKKYPAESNLPERFVKVSPNDSDQTIEIKFTILKEKLTEGTSSPTDDKEYTIKFNGFKASSN